MHRYIVDSEGQLNGFRILSPTSGDVYSKRRTILPRKPGPQAGIPLCERML